MVELTALEQRFRRLAETERLEGQTCGDNSPPGPGPRMRHRERRADEIQSRVLQLEPRFSSVAPAVAALEAKMAEIEALGRLEADQVEAGARRALFRETRRVARATAVTVNAVSEDPVIGEVAATFQQWGAEYQRAGFVRNDDPQGSTYVCFSPTAGAELTSAGVRLDRLPTVDVPDLPDFEGPNATREAVVRMIRTVSGATGADLAGAALGGGGAADPNDPAFRAGVSAGLAAQAGGGVSRAAALDQSGLQGRDQFPLLVALIVDLLLFVFVIIDRPRSLYFERFQRRIRDAVAEKVNPADQMLLIRELNESQEWGILHGYRFSHKGDLYIAVPKAMPPDEREWDAARFEVEFLRDLMFLWRRNGIVRPAWGWEMTSEQALGILKEDGALSAQYSNEFNIFRFSDRAFETILLRGLLDGPRVRRDRGRALPAPPARERVTADQDVLQLADQAGGDERGREEPTLDGPEPRRPASPREFRRVLDERKEGA